MLRLPLRIVLGVALSGAARCLATIPTSGLVLWLDANVGVTSGTDGSVSSWQDQSGNGNNATQSNSSNQPTLIANSLNGLPAIRFTASSNQWFSLPNVMNGAGAGEVFIVVKAASATPSGVRSLWTFGADCFYPYPTGNIYDYFGSTSQNEVGHPASGVDQYSLYNVSAQSGQWTARIDGVTLLNSTSNSVSFNSSPMLGTDGSNPFDGEIAEVIVYNMVLSDAQRATVGQYLQNKYNLPGISVPSNPANLTATAISGTETSLVWSDAPTSTGITYTIWRKTGSGSCATNLIIGIFKRIIG